MKKYINPKNTVHPLLSQAILHNSNYTMELSGQIGIKPESGKMVEGGIVAETEQILKNIGTILKEVGWDYENIVKVRIFLSDMENYKSMNEVYIKYFSENPPARIALAAKQLPLNCLIEVESIAVGESVK